MLKNPETVFVTILLAASVLGIMQSRSQKRNTRRTRIRAIKRELHIRNCLDDAEPETDHAPVAGDITPDPPLSGDDITDKNWQMINVEEILSVPSPLEIVG